MNFSFDRNCEHIKKILNVVKGFHGNANGNISFRILGASQLVSY